MTTMATPPSCMASQSSLRHAFNEILSLEFRAKEDGGIVTVVKESHGLCKASIGSYAQINVHCFLAMFEMMTVISVYLDKSL